METQLELLRAIARGEEPATAANLERAFNRDVLMERAVQNQAGSTEATLNALELESGKLHADLTRRTEQIEQLKAALDDSGRANETPAAKPLAQLEDLRHIVLRLAEGYLSPLGLGDSKEISQVIWRLIEVTNRNEQLVAPADLRIVQFLIDNGLVRSEPAGGNRLRIRLF